MMKMENESGDEVMEMKTPAMQTTEDSFSQPTASTKSTNSTATIPVGNEAKKVKVSPTKSKATPATGSTSNSNSKSTSPTKKKAAVAVTTPTPSKGKAAKK